MEKGGRKESKQKSREEGEWGCGMEVEFPYLFNSVLNTGDPSEIIRYACKCMGGGLDQFEVFLSGKAHNL